MIKSQPKKEAVFYIQKFYYVYDNGNVGKGKTMEFTPITINSQEEYDNLVKERIDRAKKSEREKFAGYDDFKAKAEKYDADIKARDEKYNTDIKAKDDELTAKDNTIAELNAKIKTYESDSVKAKVLKEFGLSQDLSKWITGDDEEAMRTNAQELQQIVGVQKTQPLADPESENDENDDERTALKKTLQTIRKAN